MLNHEKLSKELARATFSYVSEYAREYEQARILWNRLCSDERAAQVISQQEWPYIVPSWHNLKQGSLNEQSVVSSDCGDYSVFAVDGSQIYPDRHQGFACYLINIGMAFLQYSAKHDIKSSAHFFSEPFFMSGVVGSDERTPDWVNAQRTEFEFKAGLEVAIKHGTKKPIFLFDGSLIFWHLESKDESIHHCFLTSYCSLLQQLYEKRCLHAGYISLPKSRELVNVVRAFSESFSSTLEMEKYQGDYLVDSDVVGFFVRPGCRTIVFENRSSVVKFYPYLLRPCFFYLHNGFEVVRVEISLWIAQEPALVDRIASVILSQSIKGNGYPVCLAEAHEQAVVTAADRELFYALLQKSMFNNNCAYSVSQKSSHKRVLGI